ncbi:SPOR domain-containing protein [Scleromatobacter humisilvae]|uniref:SPOR domain-containing protein n=1 Tax=Scleromatobacter humisilvae TaxID=2897159 RepID=A0A9X1YG51_9BURK|nr:SPOR domain-containing protein [Scleromatobacter humisilvae]MCK9685899.1 SPOR domain-containing protein [Scleromatobacter humisilvae]
MKNQRGGFALGLIVGLLLGLAVALAVALYVTKTPVPLMNKGQQRTPEQDAAETERNKTWDPNAALAGKPPVRSVAPPPAAPASDTAMVPRVAAPVLPPANEGKVAAPAGSAAQARAEAPKSTRDAAAILAGRASVEAGEATPVAAAGADPFIYFVQVGAYSKAEDAEQQRAKLALAGLRATVSEREQNGRTVHRVRLGPFDRKDEADLQTDRAKAIDPDASLVRVERAKQ